MRSQEELARQIATAAHNSGLSRLDVVTEGDLQRLEKYQRAKDILLAE